MPEQDVLLSEVLTVPRNVDAEQGVLIGLLNHSDLMTHAVGFLEPEHFYTTAHAEIYRAMKVCFERQAPFEPIALAQVLQVNGMLDRAGGASYLHELQNGGVLNVHVLNAYSLRYYGKILIDLARRREMIRLCEEVQESAHDQTNQTYMAEAETLLYHVAEAYAIEEASTGSPLDEALNLIQQEKQAKGGITGLSTGFPTLDAATHGFQPWQLITVSARPGGGKSAFALNVAMHVLTEEKRPVLYLSLEMTGPELMRRVIKAMAGTDQDMVRMEQAAERLQPYRKDFLIEDAAGQTLAAIQSRILKARKQRPDLALIVVDHIGLIAPEAKARPQNRAYEIQEITSRLKTLAKTVQVPILQLAQMNRGIEARQDKKPMLSDLRDSGSIEMDSDIVLFTNIDRHDDRRPSGTATLSIAKQRDGVQMDIPMFFVPHLTRFKEKSMP